MKQQANNCKVFLLAVFIAVISSSAITLADSTTNNLLNRTQKLYVDRQSDIAMTAAQSLSGQALTGKDHNNALFISGFPIATWFTNGTPAEVQSKISALVTHAASERKVPVLVAYNAPFRDCQQYSAGGAVNTAVYKAWIDGVAAGIGKYPAVVLLEPDSLGIIPHYTNISGNTEWCQPAQLGAATAANERFEQINYAVDKLTALPHVAVYLDGTHSGWLDVGDISYRLVRAGVQRTSGFFLNVSNYQPTTRLEKYGSWIAKCIYYATSAIENEKHARHFNECASQNHPATASDFGTWSLTDQWYTTNVDKAANAPTVKTLRHFVIDTSRNGRGTWTAPTGQYSDPQVWCNPPERGLGDRPTTNTHNALLDAKLWIKVPGESDGQCTRGTSGPTDPARGMIDPDAGKWFKEQAAELIRLRNPR